MWAGGVRATLGTMSSSIRSHRDRPRVALEACLLLRASVMENDVDIDLLAPNRVFSYRPLSVLESFGGARAWGMPLERFAADQEVTLVHDALGAVLGRAGRGSRRSWGAPPRRRRVRR